MIEDSGLSAEEITDLEAAIPHISDMRAGTRGYACCRGFGYGRGRHRCADWTTDLAAARLLEGLREIASRHDIFSDVFGVGLYAAMILRRDPRTGSAVPPNGTQFGRTLHQVGRRHGLLIRPYPSHILLAPPLTISMVRPLFASGVR